MEISTSLNILPSSILNPEKSIERLARLGFEKMDVTFWDWCYQDSWFAQDDWEERIHAIARCAKDAGVVFNQGHGPVYDIFEHDNETDFFIKMSQRTMQAAGILGIEWVVFHPETIPGAFDEQHFTDMIERHVEHFSMILKIGEKVGAGIALENLHDFIANPIESVPMPYSRAAFAMPSELIRLVDAFNHSMVGVCWDFGHAMLQRLDQPCALKAIGSRLKALHVQDCDHLHDAHMPPFYGEVDWPPIMAALKEIGYQGDFTYEVGGFTMKLPDVLKDDALRYLIKIGKYLLDSYK